MSQIRDRIAELEAASKQVADDEAWAKSQFDQDGAVCIVFDAAGIRAKKFFKNGWVVQYGDTAASALHALRTKVEGGGQ